MTRFLPVVAIFATLAACSSRVDLERPARPEQLYVVSSPYHVIVFWDSVPGAYAYRVYYGGEETVGLGDSFIEVEEPRADLYFDESLPEDIYAVVTALRGNAESDPSAWVRGQRQPEYLSVSPVFDSDDVDATFGAGFGSAIESVGDFDDDGYEEVLVGAPLASNGKGAVYLLSGAPSGLRSEAMWTAVGSSSSLFGTSIAYSETALQGEEAIVVGAPGADFARVFTKGVGLELVPYLDLVPGPEGMGGAYGSTVVAAGNLDGEIPAVEEIAVSAPLAAVDGRVYVHRIGDPIGDIGLTRIEVALDGPDGSAELGFALAGVGNLETDPADDLVVGAPGFAFGDGGVAVLHGTASLFSASAPVPRTISIEYSPPNPSGGRYGAALAAVGDVDSDDRDEFIVGAPLTDCGQPGSRIVDAGTVNFQDAPFAPEEHCGGAAGQQFGASLAFAGLVLGEDEGEVFLAGSATTAGQGSFAVSQIYVDENTADPVQFSTRVERVAIARRQVVSAADVNGDERPDVLIGVPQEGRLFLYVTLPVLGPEVHAGPPIDAVAGEEVRLSAAMISDSIGAFYFCTIFWDDEAPDIIPDCTSESLRMRTHAYEAPDAGDEHEDQFVRVYVEARDGRKGMGMTRVRVRAATSE